MFSIKKIIIGVVIVSSVSFSGFFIKRNNDKKQLDEIVSKIDLNDLEGNFIIITNYANEMEYKIDSYQFEKEFDRYIENVDSNLEYKVIVNENKIRIIYKRNNVKVKKEYRLNLSNKKS